MLPVNVVWGFSRFVGSIKESCVFRILQQKLADPSVSSPHRNMNRCIATLPRGERGRDERVRRMKSREVVKKERGKRRGGEGSWKGEGESGNISRHMGGDGDSCKRANKTILTAKEKKHLRPAKTMPEWSLYHGYGDVEWNMKSYLMLSRPAQVSFKITILTRSVSTGLIERCWSW